MLSPEYEHVLERTAEKCGGTPEDIAQGIEECITEGMRNEDPQVRAIWELMASDGKRPSGEELLQFVVAALQAHPGDDGKQ